MQYTPQSLEAYDEIAEKVRSGEYFRESRNMFDIMFHDPMADRYFYILITTISSLILLLVVYAANSLYPLQTPVPFIYNVRDASEDIPRIKTLRNVEGENPDIAVLRFLVANYIRQREGYSIASVERDMNSVKIQSTKEAYAEYEKTMDTRNSQSPIALYQRHSQRRVELLSVKVNPANKKEAEVILEASVENKNETKKSLWQVNIAFSYNGLALDDNGKPKPISFLVTKYNTRRLQDTR